MTPNKIAHAELIEVALPLLEPFSTGFGTLYDRSVLLVRLETSDGLVGWGEAAQVRDPIYLEEWLNGSWHFIAEYLLPLVRANEITSYDFYQQAKRFRRNNISKFAVETALWMIEAKRSGQSYADLLGGTRQQVESGASISLQGSLEQTVKKVSDRLAIGLKRIKLKIQPRSDFQLVQAVRAQYPDIMLMVDANSSYSLDDAAALQKLDQFNLLMIEQPLAHDDIIDHATLAQELTTPICLDESICSAEDARKAIQIRACQIINVKPARVGSLYEVQKINELAKTTGTRLWCGGMLEGDIGKIANLAAASLSEFTLPADISDWKTYFASSPTDLDQSYANGVFTLGSTFGTDLEIDEAWIAERTIRKLQI